MFHKKLLKQLTLKNLLIALAVCVAAFVLVKVLRSQENFNEGEAKIYFFYVDWCPHCVKAKPEVANFKKNNANVEVVEVDCDKQKDLAKEFGVRAYPTVYGFKNGEKVEFNNRVTESNLNDFYSTLAGH